LKERSEYNYMSDIDIAASGENRGTAGATSGMATPMSVKAAIQQWKNNMNSKSQRSDTSKTASTPGDLMIGMVRKMSQQAS